MSDKEKILNNSIASLEMEGFDISEESKTFCQELLENKINISQYIKKVKELQGIA